MAGEFFQRFFEERYGTLDVNDRGEANILCPFEHDKGYEQNPSAHVNLEKGVFHCKTCSAEGRFNDGGLSEAGFIKEYYGMSYSNAVKFLQTFSEKAEGIENWETAQENLLNNQEALAYLAGRGITLDVVKEYKLGYAGAGITYPVFINGVLADKRTYNPNPAEGEPKIRSEKGASPLLFPFDHWKDDPRPTLLCAGENDTLLARKMGFNALTSTFGEGSFPEIFLGLFKGKTVYICYDCDEAGKRGSRKVAMMLHGAGATVYLVDLGLAGTKDDKDITDFFIKHGRSAEDLSKKIEEAVLFDGEQYQEERDKHYPLIDLWDVPKGCYSGKRLSSRAIMMGKFDQTMEAPTTIKWDCKNPVEGNAVCELCPVRGREGWWSLDDDNLDDLLRLVEVTDEQQKKVLHQMFSVPKKCPGRFRMTCYERKHVQKVVFGPDVDTEDELRGFRATEQIAYIIDNDLDDGQRYRIFFRRYAHPKDNQKIVLVVDRVEESDNAVNRFRVTPEILEQLSQFQGHPDAVMEHRYKVSKNIVDPYVPRPVVEAVNIMYHSVLDFKYAGKPVKGHPEGLIIGPSRTGKTDTAKKWMQFLGVGNMTDCKSSSVAGLLGGADKMPNGSYRIKWGKIPRNHKGLLIMDELSGMQQGIMPQLTALRSERIARLEKIVSGAAPAKTRLLWISNPRVQEDGQSKPIELYNNGVEIVLDLIGSDEDVARFDFIVLLPNNTVYISPFTDRELEEVDNPAYRNLVYWAWSRTQDQITFAPGVEEYIWQVAQELNEAYDTNVKIFGPEAHKKLARVAVSVAVMCFSHDGSGERVIVQKEHVDWSRGFLVRCYNNEVFRLAEYVQQQRATSTVTEEIFAVFSHLVKSQQHLMQVLAKTSGLTLNHLQIVTGMDRDQFKDAISNLVSHGLIRTGKNGSVEPTMRFRRCRDMYIKGIDKQSITPLSQQGGLPI